MKRLALALLFLAAPCVRAADLPALQEGDTLFSARTADAGGAEALALYERAITENPASAEARWKAARALLWLGDHGIGKARRTFYERGIAAAEEAVRLDPGSPDARFWLGALYGSYGEERGVLKSLSLLKPIREQMTELNRIDERFGGGAGIRVLGIVDYKVPAFAGGSRKRAGERLEAALKIDPTNPFNHYYMAEYLAGMGKKKEAEGHLAEVARARPSADVDAADLAMIQDKARTLEKKISG